MFYEKCINVLGCKARDKVTGFKGTITSICFDAYGCIQVTLTPSVGKDGKTGELYGWIDINRIDILNNKSVVIKPEFSSYKTFADTHGADNFKPLK
jgi:hypothetical protein